VVALRDKTMASVVIGLDRTLRYLVSCALSSYHNYGRIGYGENWSSQSGSGVDGYRA
jgi:hypothetical protein